MAKINLLPWREEFRQKQQKDFVTALIVAAVVTSLLFAAGYFYIEGLKDHQERRNKIVQDEIKIVDQVITEIKDIEQKKDLLLTKIDVIQDLQESRSQVVHLFDELSKRTPEGVRLTKFVQVGKKLVLTGSAKTNARVSAYMRGVDSSLWLDKPVLKEIKSDKSCDTKSKNRGSNCNKSGDGNSNQNKIFILHAGQKKSQSTTRNR